MRPGRARCVSLACRARAGGSPLPSRRRYARWGQGLERGTGLRLGRVQGGIDDPRHHRIDLDLGAGQFRGQEAPAEHPCVQFELPSSGRRGPWSFQVEGRQGNMRTSGSLTCLEDLLATVIAVKNGGELMEVLARSG